MNFIGFFNLKNQRNLIYFLALTAAMLLNSCNNPDKSPDISFYYWKTRFSLSTYEINVLKTNGVKNLYLRYFDIDLNESATEAVPVSPVIFDNKYEQIRIVPVVYIKNRVFLNKNADFDLLSKKTIGYISQINKINHIEIDEIQLDCDWTTDSRENYFNFITKIKEYSKLKVSATIRLHQVKYYMQTKIPDVDQGVLMYYNMGHIGVDNSNSIYERQIATKYIESLKNYPLKLNIALPIFAWGIHIRNNKPIELINKMDIKAFVLDTNFIKTDKIRLKAKRNYIKFGYYFKQNDEVKIEQINVVDLIEMAGDLSKNLKQKPLEVIFYDFDSININKYNNEIQNFEKIIDNF